MAHMAVWIAKLGPGVSAKSHLADGEIIQAPQQTERKEILRYGLGSPLSTRHREIFIPQLHILTVPKGKKMGKQKSFCKAFFCLTQSCEAGFGAYTESQQLSLLQL